MRILSTVVEVTAHTVLHIGQESTPRDAVAPKAIGDDALRLILETVQQATEEPLRRGAIALLLDQNVQHHAMLIHRPPEVVQHTVDANENFIQVPGVARSRPPAMQAPRVFGTKLVAPVADALPRHQDATLGQDEFDVPEAEAEQMIQPYGVADDLSLKAMAAIQGCWSGHSSTLARRPASGKSGVNLPMPLALLGMVASFVCAFFLHIPNVVA